LSWPETTEATHGQIVTVFLNSGAIYLMPQEIFKKQISLCLLYFNDLKHCITKCPEALPSVQDIKCIAYLESIVKYIMFGTTAQLNYEHLKGMLVNATIGSSVESGVVRFKRVFPPTTMSTLQVLPNVKLPYPFLAGNINTVIKHISLTPVPFQMNKCIEKIMIIVGTYSRQMCGFGVGEPTKSTTVFSSKTLARVKNDNVWYTMQYSRIITSR